MGYAQAVGCGIVWLMLTSQAFSAHPTASHARWFRVGGRTIGAWFNRAVGSWFALALLLLISGNAAAQQQARTRSEEAKKTVFQVLRLRDRSVLYGVQLGRNANEIYFGVRREWLNRNDPVHQQRVAAAASEERKAYERLIARLETELAVRADQPYRFVFEQELERSRAWLLHESSIESELLLLTIPLADIVRMEKVSGDHLHLAMWAWKKQIDAPESKDADELGKLLIGMKVNFKTDFPDVGSMFQALPQSDDEWQARLALLRFSREQAIEFQGAEGMMVRIKGGNAPAEIGQLIAQTVGNSSKNVLEDLLKDGVKSTRTPANRSDWIEQCIAKLHGTEEDYLRATRVETDLASGQARVESVFVFKSSRAGWIPIWRAESSVDAKTVPAASLQRLEEDPQIQSLRSLLSSLGIGSDDLIQEAVLLGAATMQAQQQVNSQFEFFRQRYQHRLDLPALRWDVTQN